MNFEDIKKYKWGDTIQIAGMVLQGDRMTIAAMLPNTDIVKGNIIADLSAPSFQMKETSDIIPLHLTNDQWIELLQQLDTLEVELFPNSELAVKPIVRKSQRQIDMNIQWEVFRRDHFTCQYCNNSKVPMTIDHIIPWEDLGQTHPDNLLTSCKKCNKTRGSMPFMDWITKLNTSERFYPMAIAQSIYDKAKALPLRTQQRSR